MKPTPLLIILSIAVLVLAGCTQRDGGSVTDPFIGGNDAITMSFEKNAPPSEAFDGGDNPFDISVKLENLGEYEVPKDKATVKISGFLASEFDTTDAALKKNPTEDLIGKRRSADDKVLDGTAVNVDFNDLNHKSILSSASQTYPIRADACYNYGTTAVSQLCVRSSILNPAEEGLCEIEETKTVYNSGAPVQVSNLAENPRAKDKVGFTFDITHAGTGKVFERDSGCDESKRTFTEKIKVKVDSRIAGLSCSGLEDKGSGIAEGTVTLTDAGKTVSCTQTIASARDYEFPVTITLNYDYQTTINTEITIKHSGE